MKNNPHYRISEKVLNRMIRELAKKEGKSSANTLHSIIETRVKEGSIELYRNVIE